MIRAVRWIMFGAPCVDWFGCSFRIAADVWNSLEAFKDYSNDFLMIVSYADSQGMLATCEHPASKQRVNVC
jgi:hypothetical protein